MPFKICRKCEETYLISKGCPRCKKEIELSRTKNKNYVDIPSHKDKKTNKKEGESYKKEKNPMLKFFNKMGHNGIIREKI